MNRIIEARSKKRLTSSVLRAFEKEAAQLMESVQEILRIDFFSTSPPGEVQEIVERIKKGLEGATPAAGAALPGHYRREQFRNKVWATRKNIHIDRICSAWLIRRFIDPAARFVFAAENNLPKDAIVFDVFGAEFSHHGEDCTFETLVKCFSLSEKGVKAIGEIIHDIDLKDHKFGRLEAAGVDAVIRALAGSVHDDHKLLDAGSVILDALFEHYSQRGQRRGSA